MEPYTIIEILQKGGTIPQIEDEVEIILIQDGEVTVGMLGYDDEDTSTLFIDSPVNELELNKVAYKLVIEKYPEYLKSEHPVVLVAPSEIAREMEW